MIKKTVLEFKFTKMEINTKVNGKTIKDMVKELYGEKTQKTNLLENTQENGNSIKNGDQVQNFLKIKIDMMDFGKMIK